MSLTISRWAKALLVAFALLIVYSCLSRQWNSDGRDFLAYWRAGFRFLHGEPIYQNELYPPFKYAPITALYFIPLSLLPYLVARWVYAFLHAGWIMALPFLAGSLLRRDPRVRDRLTEKTFVTALVVSFVASFRFLDGEFHVSQVSTMALGIMLLGVWTAGKPGTWRQVLALALIAAGAIVKIHTLMVFMLFLKRDTWKNWAVLVGVVAAFLLLPDPTLWGKWVEQIQVTATYNPIARESYNMQGVYPTAIWFLGMSQYSARPLLLFLPLFLITLFFVPKFRYEDLQTKTASLLPSLAIIVLLAGFGSPLPWQHNYSVLWVIMVAAWISGTRGERGVLLALALFLGLSPKGIAGLAISTWLEGYQSIFIALLVLWAVLFRQARRFDVEPA